MQATLLVADANNTFELTGNGDVLEPFHGVMGIGSGGMFAQGECERECGVVSV